MVYHVSHSVKEKDNKDPEVLSDKLLEDGSSQQTLNRSLQSKLSLWSAVNFILALLAVAILAILGMLCTDAVEGEVVVVFIIFGIHVFSTLASAVCSWRMETRGGSSVGLNLLIMLASGVILLSAIGIIGFFSMINKSSLNETCEQNAAIYLLAYGVSSIIMYSFSWIVFSFCFS